MQDVNNVNTNVNNDANLNSASSQENTTNTMEGTAVTTDAKNESEIIEENTSHNSGGNPSLQESQQTNTTTTGKFMSSYRN